jgi:type IV pilus assembly protein PilY1
VGKLAEIADASVDTKKRRFFEAASVVQVRDTVFSNESDYDYVLIGTGYRPGPLDTEVEDRFYAFRDFFIGANEMQDVNNNNVSESPDSYPQTSGAAYSDTDLIDVTSSALDSADSTHKEGSGWFYDFTDAGTTAEKVLSSPITAGGIVTFTTFSPEATSSSGDPCGASPGLGTAYNFDILSAGAALDFNGDGYVDIDDRTFTLSGGIPSAVVPVFTNEGVIGIVGVEGGSQSLGTLTAVTTSREYWYEGRSF